MSSALAGPTASSSPLQKTSAANAPPATLEKSSVAELSPVQIARMSRPQLIAAIRAAELPLTAESAEKLPGYDRATLERLVYLARRSCRNQGY